MLIGFIGDVHGKVFDALAAVAIWQRRSGRQFDFIVQVGDMGAYPDPERADAPTRRYMELDPSQADFARLLRADGSLAERAREMRDRLGAPIHFLRGNHEDFAYLAGLPLEDAGSAPVDGCEVLRFLPDGTVLDLGPVRLAVLGGAEEQPGDAGIDREAYDRVMALAPGDLDVLVTHEGPHGSSSGFRGDLQGSKLMTELVERLRPRFHVAGHVHTLIGPRSYGNTTYLGLASLVASTRWKPEARGLQPGCLALLDTDSGELAPITDGWLEEFETPFDFEAWASGWLDGR
jgi:hypothetical protein